MPDTVIFDLGGVLIDWNPRYLYRKLFANEAEMETFLATVCTPDWNEQQDAGRPITEAVATLVAEWPEHEDMITAYYDRWLEMVGGALEETVEVMTALHERRVPLYALTNWSAETFPLVTGHYDFFAWFRGIVVSGLEKVKKPDPKIYRLLLERYDLAPSQTVFIDDKDENIEAARTVGMRGIPFTNANALHRDLQAMDLL